MDYVRQGAMISESMIVMQDASHYKRCRDKYLSVITDKHQNTMSKMGAILSTGILNGIAHISNFTSMYDSQHNPALHRVALFAHRLQHP